MVQIIEVVEASKGEFRRLGVGEGGVGVELEKLEAMKDAAEELGVRIIYKRGKEYFFRANNITHYCKE